MRGSCSVKFTNEYVNKQTNINFYSMELNNVHRKELIFSIIVSSCQSSTDHIFKVTYLSIVCQRIDTVDHSDLNIFTDYFSICKNGLGEALVTVYI